MYFFLIKDTVKIPTGVCCLFLAICYFTLSSISCLKIISLCSIFRQKLGKLIECVRSGRVELFFNTSTNRAPSATLVLRLKVKNLLLG